MTGSLRRTRGGSLASGAGERFDLGWLTGVWRGQVNPEPVPKGGSSATYTSCGLVTRAANPARSL